MFKLTIGAVLSILSWIFRDSVDDIAPLAGMTLARPVKKPVVSEGPDKDDRYVGTYVDLEYVIDGDEYLFAVVPETMDIIPDAIYDMSHIKTEYVKEGARSRIRFDTPLGKRVARIGDTLVLHEDNTLSVIRGDK